MFSTAQNACLLRGRSVENIAAGSLYGACRCAGRPLLLSEVAQVARVPESKVALGYRVLNREVELAAEPVLCAVPPAVRRRVAVVIGG